MTGSKKLQSLFESYSNLLCLEDGGYPLRLEPEDGEYNYQREHGYVTRDPDAQVTHEQGRQDHLGEGKRETTDYGAVDVIEAPQDAPGDDCHHELVGAAHGCGSPHGDGGPRYPRQGSGEEPRSARCTDGLRPVIFKLERME